MSLQLAEKFSGFKDTETIPMGPSDPKSSAFQIY